MQPTERLVSVVCVHRGEYYRSLGTLCTYAGGTRLSSTPRAKQYQTFREVAIEAFRHVDTNKSGGTCRASVRRIVYTARTTFIVSRSLSALKRDTLYRIRSSPL